MKNRFYLLFIIMLITLGIGGCKDTQQSPQNHLETSLSSTPSDKSPMSTYMDTYLSVLQKKTSFFSTDAKKELNISQINQAVSDDSSVKAEVAKFAIVDLDNNKIPEVILWLVVNNNDYYGFEVLRYQDGIVYGYTVVYRAFMELKDDGTFSFSGGVADNGFGTMEFTNEGIKINKITYSESSSDSNNYQIVSYFVNQKSAAKENFLSAINKQDEKPGATWYDFTDENIETLLSDNN